MDQRTAHPPRTFRLTLETTGPKPLSEAHRARWPAIVRDVDLESVRTGVAFVAELLELLDGGATCRFTGGHHVSGFGGVGEAWTLSTGRLQLTRAFESTYDSESCRVVVEENRFEDASGGPGPRLRWDGEWRLDGAVDLEILEADEPLIERILALAEDFFSRVRARRDPPEPTPPSPPPRPVPEPLPSPPEQGYALVWLDLDSGYLAGSRAIAYFASREDGESYLVAHAASYPSGTPNRDCWTEHRVVELRNGELVIPLPRRH